ncbi:MAG TPA: family 16 glycoside hydrolase, partial [Pirellulales bacterium]|nr:family 16 glycoside hydrolase [Pirellulales bacterium]
MQSSIVARSSLLLVALAVGFVGAAPARGADAPVVPPKTGESETIKLFNGQNLDGWHGHKDKWSVVDGVIVGKNHEQVKVSTYLLTDRNFSDFRLLATVKLVKSEMHSGIALWG